MREPSHAQRRSLTPMTERLRLTRGTARKTIHLVTGGDVARAFEEAFSAEGDHSIDLRMSLGAGFVGVNQKDRATLVVPLETTSLPAGRSLGNVRLTFNPSLTFRFQETAFEKPAAVIECLERELLPTFVVVLRDVVAQVGDTPTATAVIEALRTWDKLLRASARMGKPEAQGLWGELEFLSRLPDVEAGLRAWRGPSNAAMDFNNGGVAIEVKTSFEQLRHRFSLQQTRYRPERAEALVASLWIEHDDIDGRTLGAQVDRVAGLVADSDMLVRKTRQVGYRLEHRDVYTECLILQAPPRLYRMSEVPSVREIDAGVTDVKFNSNLAHAQQLSSGESNEVMGALCGFGGSSGSD